VLISKHNPAQLDWVSSDAMATRGGTMARYSRCRNGYAPEARRRRPHGFRRFRFLSEKSQ
jgi:hypothetical protein